MTLLCFTNKAWPTWLPL